VSAAVENDLLSRLEQVGAMVGANLRAIYFPEDGPFSRHLYPRSMEFFAATGTGLYKVFSLFGGNRTGKTFSPCFAVACWVTGDYPDWWDEVGGLRFQKPIRVWCAGETGTLVRETLQRYLIGNKERLGQGCLIPPENIGHAAWQTKPQGLCEKVIIKGRFGESTIFFKSYDAGRVRFASDVADVVVLDEEPPAGIFSECLTRTGTTKGIIINAFTALKGVTPLVGMLLPQYAGGEDVDQLDVARWHTFIGWDDIPVAQLSMQERKRLASSYLASELMARTKGIPTIGSGMVWPVQESDILVPAFAPPEDWPRLVALDPGFEHGTGALLFALDQESDALYIAADHWKRLEHLSVHAAKIHAWGEWIPTVIDYASGVNVDDGEAVKSKYRKALKNPVFNANKAFSLGGAEVYDRMCDGRLFVMDSCRLWLEHFRQYVRNEKGKIAMPKDARDPKFHHFELMDCTRYGAMGIQHAKVMPAEVRSRRRQHLPDREQGPEQSINVMRGVL